MKLSSLFSVFIFLSLDAAAFDYQLACEGRKLTKFENVSVNQNSEECAAFKANGYTVCFDSKKINRSPHLITLSTPNDHYYQSKESNRYSKSQVQQIIDSAIKAGNDPYLTLAIVMNENPPIVSQQKNIDKSQSQSYLSSFGAVPIDAIAVADTMGCDREKTGYDDNGLIVVRNRGSQLRQFVENPKGKKHIVCIDNFAAGESPTFFVSSKKPENSCCMMLTSNPSGIVHQAMREVEDGVFSYPNDELRLKILDMMAQRYMRSRFVAAQDKAVTFKRPEERMAITAQAFNGFGRLGVTESINNQCLSKVHMGTTPIYGAGTSELMVNTLMNNSEIKDMVTKSLTRQNKPYIESYLCSAYGSGEHSVSGYAFTGLLRDYLSGRKSCPQYTNKLKNLNRILKPRPAMPLPVQNSPSNGADGVRPQGPAAN